MIEHRKFGNTGHMSTATIFGGAALMTSDDAKADRALGLLLEHGINHIDTAAGYGDAELWIGKWMKAHRKDFFLASKTDKRDYTAAREQIRRSLERLQVEQLDLIQLHALVHPDEWDQAMGDDGALRAAVEARDEGLVRFIGVTGHGWNVAAMHLRSLARFHFDSVLLPYNAVMMRNPRYQEDFEAVVELCRARNVAIQTIKSIARGPWATRDRDRTTWYRPLESSSDIDTAVRYVLTRPELFLLTAGDVDLLPDTLQASHGPIEAPADDEMERLLVGQKMSSLFGI
jgi:aryl-alcohol dehydrogenase-like predicted oxidoreductase